MYQRGSSPMVACRRPIRRLDSTYASSNWPVAIAFQCPSWLFCARLICGAPEKNFETSGTLTSFS